MVHHETSFSEFTENEPAASTTPAAQEAGAEIMAAQPDDDEQAMAKALADAAAAALEEAEWDMDIPDDSSKTRAASNELPKADDEAMDGEVEMTARAETPPVGTVALPAMVETSEIEMAESTGQATLETPPTATTLPAVRTHDDHTLSSEEVSSTNAQTEQREISPETDEVPATQPKVSEAVADMPVDSDESDEALQAEAGSESPTKEEMLQANKNDDVEVLGNERRIQVVLPYGSLEAAVDDENSKKVFLDDVQVPEEIRGEGTATRLVREFGEECLERGIETIEASVTHPHALQTLASVFGEESLDYGPHPHSAPDDPTPETMFIERAVGVLEEMNDIAEQYHERGETPPVEIANGLPVSIDLTRPGTVREIRDIPVTSLEAEEMLAENAAAAPRVRRMNHEDDEWELRIELPHGHAEVVPEGTVGALHYFEVPSQIWGHDTGSRLLAAAGQECVRRGFETMRADFVAPNALACAAKVFGEEGMTFYAEPEKGQRVSIPFSYGQMMQSAERARTKRNNLYAARRIEEAVDVDTFTLCTFDLTDPRVLQALEEAAERYNV